MVFIWARLPVQLNDNLQNIKRWWKRQNVPVIVIFNLWCFRLPGILILYRMQILLLLIYAFLPDLDCWDFKLVIYALFYDGTVYVSHMNDWLSWFMYYILWNAVTSLGGNKVI